MDALVVPLWAYFNNADCMDALVVPQLKLLQYMNVLLKNKKKVNGVHNLLLVGA
jgi:hypothetical protein